MSWSRRLGIIGLLIVAQAGIIVCYQGLLNGTAAPAAAQEQKPVPVADRPADDKELKEAIPVRPNDPTAPEPPAGATVPTPLPQSVDLIAKPVEAVPAVP